MVFFGFYSCEQKVKNQDFLDDFQTLWYSPGQPAHEVTIFPGMMNELLYSQGHGDQADCQIADRHVDNKKIASSSGLGITNDDVTDAEVTQDS